MSELEAPTSEDWSAKATDTIVGYVDTVRNKTTGKALVVSRLAVYFLAAGLIGIVAVIILLIGAVRLVVAATEAVPTVDEGEVWLTYWIFGLLFLGVGWFLWRKRGR